MTNRIRYRLVFNRGGKLNQYGEGLVSIELSLHGRKIYFSTHTYLKPHQWSNGMVVNHALENKLNYTLGKMLIEIEEVELDAILQGRQVTLIYMRNAIRNAVTTTARLERLHYKCHRPLRAKSADQAELPHGGQRCGPVQT